MNVAEIFEASSGLRQLRQDIIVDRDFILPMRRDQVWSALYKQKMLRLVGFSSTDPQLMGSDSYERTYQALADALDKGST